jgi:hypothetical protein
MSNLDSPRTEFPIIDAIRRRISWYHQRGLDISAIFLHPDEPLPTTDYFVKNPKPEQETLWGKPVVRKDFVKRGSAYVHVSGFSAVEW